MTQTARTAPVGRTSTDPADDLDDGLSVSPSDIGERLWHFFISMKTGLALILGLAVLGLIGTMLVQAPAGLQNDPQAYATWLESLRPKYGGWTGVFDTLGLFNIFSSVWFRGIMVLLMTSVLACSANRAPHLWKLTVHPRMRMSEGFFEHAPSSLVATTAVEPSEAAQRVAAALRHHGFRTIVEEDGDVVHVYADHNRWGPFGTVIAHLSLVLILLGALAGGTFGFRNNAFAVAVGSTAQIGNGTGLSVEAKGFSDSYYADGSPSDYASELVVYRDGQQVGASTVRVNQPMEVAGVTLYQSYFGAAAAMKIADASGRVLYRQGVPLEWTSSDGSRVVGLIALPDAGLNIYVLGARSGEVDPAIRPGQMQVEVYKAGADGTPIATQIVTQGEAVEMAGLEVTFERERQFTGLIVANDPGAMFVWLGAMFLIGGTALVFFFPCRRAWGLVRRRPDGSIVHVGAIVRHDVGFEAEFGRLAIEIEEALAGPTTPGRDR